MTLDLGIVTGSLSPAAGGLFESVRLSANKLAQAGAHVTVYGLWDDQFEAARLAWQVTHLETFRISGPQRLGFSLEMLRKVVAADHQLLHLHGIWFFPSYVVDKWHRKTRRPAVISPRGMLDPWAVNNSALKKRALRMLYEDRNLNGATVLHALNECEVEAIRAFGLTNPIAVIPNGVDLPDLESDIAKPEWMRGDDRKVLLFLGRLHPKKGLSELLSAWEKVVRAKPATADTWRLAIAGWDDGGHRAELETLIANSGVGKHIVITGPLHGASKHAGFRYSSAFILPSHSEGMPMAVLEAWAYGLPVFMTKACNLLHGFECGAAIEIATEPNAMAATLAASLNDHPQLESIGQVGYALVERTYTWDRIVTDTRRLYDWVLGGGDRPEFIR